MATVEQLPFESFSFTLLDNKRPRAAFRMAAAEDGMYELRVQKGSAANPSSQFTRLVPLQIAQRLKDSLQAIGVFGWDESYGDTTAPGSRRWTVSTVFKAGVFSVASSGGSDTPIGFESMLEELYRLDFPRPETPPASSMSGSRTSGGEGLGVDYNQLADLMKGSGLEGLDASEMTRLLDEARTNPYALQQRMRDEFRHMPADEQERMLDALAASGMGSRGWWERFLRG